jgi:hypothetical protein
MRGDVSYTTAAGSWSRRGALVEIRSVLDTPIAKFPLQFLAGSGDNSWSYIRYVISLLIVEDPEHPGDIFTESDELVDQSSVPVSGPYKFIENGECRIRRRSFVLDLFVNLLQVKSARSH